MPAHADDTVEPELDAWPFTMEPDSFQQEPELDAWPSTTKQWTPESFLPEPELDAWPRTEPDSFQQGPELDAWPSMTERDSFQQEPELDAWPSTTELPMEALPGLSTPEPSVLPETNAGGSTCCRPRRGQQRRGCMPPLEDEDLAFELPHITAPSRSDVVHTLDEGPQMFDCSLVRRMQQGADAPRLLSLHKRKPVQWQSPLGDHQVLVTASNDPCKGGCFIEGEGVPEAIAPDGLNPEALLVDQNGKKYWLVKRILDRRMEGGKMWYLVQWEGWVEPSWEPEECAGLLADWE